MTNGRTATIKCFNSATNEPILFTVPIAFMRQFEIPVKIRILLLDPAVGVWRVGRVIDGEGDRFAIRFPNGDECCCLFPIR